MNKKLNKTN